MTTTRRPSSRKTPIKPIEPADVRIKKARKLPMPGPGIVVSVPLALLPEYLALYGLTPMTRGEVIDYETASKRWKPAGMLYVRRTASPVKRVKVGNKTLDT